MATRLPGPVFSSVKLRFKRRYYITLLVIVVLGGLGWGIYNHYHNRNSAPPNINTGATLTTQQENATITKTAQQALDSKDYQEAVASYVAASTNSFDAKDYAQARNYLQECIAKVPDSYVDWHVYDSLAVIAQIQKDTNLERSSLQTALQKAQAPNSGASTADISLIQNTIKGLK